MTDTGQQVETGEALPAVRRFRSPFSPVNLARQLAQRPLSLAGTLIFLLFILLAIIGPMIAPYEFDELIAGSLSKSPALEHPFGTDRLGRELSGLEYRYV